MPALLEMFTENVNDAEGEGTRLGDVLTLGVVETGGVDVVWDPGVEVLEDEQPAKTARTTNKTTDNKSLPEKDLRYFIIYLHFYTPYGNL